MRDRYGLYQRYNLGGQHYHSFYEFDLKNKKVKLISQGITEDLRKKNGLMFEDKENSEIAESLIIKDKFHEFELSDKTAKKIGTEFEKFDHYNHDSISGIWGLSDIILNKKYRFANESGTKGYFDEYSNYFPDSWIDFGIYLIDTFGFDLLNISLRKLITKLHYIIQPNGVYDKKTLKKLNLNKVNFHISSIEEPYNPYNFSIDSSDRNFEMILELLEKYGVYMWSDENYLENITKRDDFNDFKGNSWFIELIFDDGEVLNLRGDNAYPDTYIHLGEELLEYGKDFLRISEIDEERREFIKSVGENKISENRDFIERIDFNQVMYLNGFNWHEFSIDCMNSVALPKDNVHEPYKEHSRDLLEINFNILESFFDNFLKEKMTLNREKLDEFLKNFKKLNFIGIDDKSGIFSKKCLRNEISVHYSWGDVSYDLSDYPEIWKELGKMLKELFGFDILNIENSRRIISPLYYEALNDGIYDKKTGERLKLRSIEYGHGTVLDYLIFYNIFVDLEKKRSCGLIEKENLDDETIDDIIRLVEKYHVYEWRNDEFWEKAKYHRWSGFDGYNWYLTLTFEGDIVLNLEGGNDYPDTFVHLAEDIIDMYGKDVLKLKTIGEEDRKLYKKYGDLRLKE